MPDRMDKANHQLQIGNRQPAQDAAEVRLADSSASSELPLPQAHRSGAQLPPETSRGFTNGDIDWVNSDGTDRARWHLLGGY